MISGLRVAVLGAGSAGRRHIANLKELGANVSAWRERRDCAAALAKEFGIEVHESAEEAINDSDAVVVATATDRHLVHALTAAKVGKPFYLEKPVSHSAAGLNELELAAESGVNEVGTQLRFHPALLHFRKLLAQSADGPVRTFRAFAGQHLEDWRPGSDWRNGYSADASRGGGVLFELIHELNLVAWLLGPVRSVMAELSDGDDLGLTCDVVANLVVTVAGGPAGIIQTDMVTPGLRRGFEVVREGAHVSFDYSDGLIVRSTREGSEVVFATPPDFARNDMFLSHMRYFLRRAAGENLPPICSLSEGIADVRLALAARTSAMEGRRTLPELLA